VNTALNVLFWVYAVAGIGWALLPLLVRGEAVGWAFYRRAMRAAERKRTRRELARIELDTAMMRWQTAQLAMISSLHQHAHTMAGLTGQPYLVPAQLRGLEAILPVSLTTCDPRYQPWKYPPS
jgi:hypothetical protein